MWFLGLKFQIWPYMGGGICAVNLPLGAQRHKMAQKGQNHVFSYLGLREVFVYSVYTLLVELAQSIGMG